GEAKIWRSSASETPACRAISASPISSIAPCASRVMKASMMRSRAGFAAPLVEEVAALRGGLRAMTELQRKRSDATLQCKEQGRILPERDSASAQVHSASCRDRRV